MGSGESFLPSYINGVQAPSFLFPLPLPLPLPFQQPNNLSYFQPPQVGQAPTFPTSGVTYSGELAPAFQPYNRAPHFQTPPSLTSSPSSSSGSSTSLQCTLTPSPAPSRKKAQKVNPKTKSKGKQAIQNVLHAARHKLLTVKPSRKRAPNNRPPGTAFSDLLVRSFRLISDNSKTSPNLTELSHGIAGRSPRRSPNGPGYGLYRMLRGDKHCGHLYDTKAQVLQQTLPQYTQRVSRICPQFYLPGIPRFPQRVQNCKVSFSLAPSPCYVH